MQLQGRKEQLEGELRRVNNEINAAEDELSGQSLKQEAFALQVTSAWISEDEDLQLQLHILCSACSAAGCQKAPSWS